MRKLFLGLTALLFAHGATAQSVQQSGTVTPGHAVQWVTNGVVKDSGSPLPVSGLGSGGTSTSNGLPLWVGTGGAQVQDGNGQTIVGNYTWGGTQTYSALDTFNGAVNFTSTFQIGGQTFTWPAAGTTVGGLGTNQTWTGTNNFTGALQVSGTSVPVQSSANTWTNTNNFTGTFQIGGNTMTFPGVADTVATLGVNQTFTGTNTFSTPLTVSSGGTGNGTATTHSVPINEGTSAQSNTGAGSAGQCLVSNGASADPSYQACFGYLGTVSVSSGTITDTTILAAQGANFRSFKLVLKNIVPSTNNTNLTLLVHSGGSFPATNYLSNTTTVAGNSAAVNLLSTTAVLLTSGVDNAAPGISGQLTVSGIAGTSAPKMWFGQTSYLTASGGSNSVSLVGGFWNGGNGAIDGFQFSEIGGGNITSGSVDIYGVQ